MPIPEDVPAWTEFIESYNDYHATEQELSFIGRWGAGAFFGGLALAYTCQHSLPEIAHSAEMAMYGGGVGMLAYAVGSVKNHFSYRQRVHDWLTADTVPEPDYGVN